MKQSIIETLDDNEGRVLATVVVVISPEGSIVTLGTLWNESGIASQDSSLREVCSSLNSIFELYYPEIIDKWGQAVVTGDWPPGSLEHRNKLGHMMHAILLAAEQHQLPLSKEHLIGVVSKLGFDPDFVNSYVDEMIKDRFIAQEADRLRLLPREYTISARDLYWDFLQAHKDVLWDSSSFSSLTHDHLVLDKWLVSYGDTVSTGTSLCVVRDSRNRVVEIKHHMPTMRVHKLCIDTGMHFAPEVEPVIVFTRTE